MASDAPRRRRSSGAVQSSSNIASTSAPQQKPAAPAKSAFSRFFGTARAPVEVPKPTSGYVTSRFLNRPNPSASQWAQLDTGSSLSALAYNDDRTHAILAGRHVLQTVYVNDKSCIKEFDLREAWAKREGQHGDRRNAVVDIHCVKWSHGWGKNYIAGATTNGKIIVYDLAAQGAEYCRLQEHIRQVHTIAFNPFSGHLLLSGSQDDSVRLWDLRARNDGANFAQSSRGKFLGAREGVRDVKWSPKEGHDFALGTGTGEIQVWDSRSNAGPKIRINAHDTRCVAVDWHPDGKHLLSAGIDQNVKVWDTLKDVRRSTPKWALRTPYPIMHARWRPPCFSAGAKESKGLQQSTMIATSYDKTGLPVIHVWDFRRPHIPFRVLDDFQSEPTDMIWHSQDLLWTVGREGVFTQSDVTYAFRPIEERPRIPFAVSPHGEIVAFRGNKIKSRRPSTLLPREIERKSPVNPSGSRSSYDDSLDESFLLSSYKPHHIRRASNRSAKSASSTPPSANSTVNVALARNEELVVHFDVVMADLKKVRKPKQISFRGQLHGVISPLVSMYLARKLQMEPLNTMTELEMILGLAKLLERNAVSYERASLHRQAQTWRLLSSVLVADLRAPLYDVLEMVVAMENEPMHNGSSLPEVGYELPEGEQFQEMTAEDLYGDKKWDPNRGWQTVKRIAVAASDDDGVHSEHRRDPPAGTTDDTAIVEEAKMSSRLQSGFDVGVSTSEVSTPRVVAQGTRIHPVSDLALPASMVGDDTHSKTQIRLGTDADKSPSRSTDVDQPSRPVVVGLANEAVASSHKDRLAPAPVSFQTGDQISPLERHDSNDSFSIDFALSEEAPVEHSDSFGVSIDSSDDYRPSTTASHSQHGIQIPAARNAASQTYGNRGRSGSTGAAKDQSFTTDESSDLSSGPSFPSRSKFDLSTITNVDKDGNRANQAQHDHRTDNIHSKDRSDDRVRPQDKVLQEMQDRYPFLGAIVHPDTNRQLNEQDIIRLVEEAASFLPPNIEDQHAEQLLARLSASSFKPILPNSDTPSMVDMAQLRTQLQDYYTQTLPDAQMLEAINRILDSVLGPQHYSPEQEAAVWSTYFEQLHRNGQHSIANRLASTVHAQASIQSSNPAAPESEPSTMVNKATATEWPNSTMSINCSRCDKPANSGICSKCSQILGQCAYCWQRDSPYDWPPKTKKQRDAEIYPLSSTSRPAGHQDPAPVYIPRAPGAVGPHGLWSFCMSCNHGLHAGCREQRRTELLLKDRWNSCPIAGCDCECIPTAREPSPAPENVVEDDNRAQETKAVKAVGKMLDTVQTGGKKVGFILGD